MKLRTSIPRRSFPLLGRLYATLGGLGESKILRPRGPCQLSRTSIKVLLKDLPVEIQLGGTGKRLQIHYESRLDQSCLSVPNIFVIDPDQYAAGIHGFFRLKPGTRAVLGRGDRIQQAMLAFPLGARRFHLLIVHCGDGVIVRNLSQDGATLGSIPDELQPHRIAVVKRLLDLLGANREPLPPAAALDLLRKVNDLANRAPYQPVDAQGLPGGLLELPYHLTPVLVGDLHGQFENLLTILSQNRFLEMIERGKAYLLLLGDLVHSEENNLLANMDGSMVMMDLYFRLKSLFPLGVFFIRGNHDSFAEEVSKQGIPQGLLWAKALRERRGLAYLEGMEQFYNTLPYMAVSGDYIACHGGPPRTKVSRDLLINMKGDPSLVREVISNRFRHPGNMQGYTNRHIEDLRLVLGLTIPNTAVIVGHTPVNYQDTLWANAGGIKGHYILFSAKPNEVGLITRVGGWFVPMRFAVEEVTRQSS